MFVRSLEWMTISNMLVSDFMQRTANQLPKAWKFFVSFLASIPLRQHMMLRDIHA